MFSEIHTLAKVGLLHEATSIHTCGEASPVVFWTCYFDMNIHRLQNDFLRWQRFERADSGLAMSLRSRVAGELRALVRWHSPVMLKGPVGRNCSAKQLESGSRAD
jgi:hypothetical protein